MKGRGYAARHLHRRRCSNPPTNSPTAQYTISQQCQGILKNSLNRYEGERSRSIPLAPFLYSGPVLCLL